MKLCTQSIFECPAEKVRAEVVTSKLMLAVCKPLVHFIPIQPSMLPHIWEPGDYVLKIYLLEKIPFGQHTIRISYPESHSKNLFQLRDNGGSKMIPVWDHLITIQSINSERTLYKDEIEIDAGKLTFFVYLFAKYYYWHRQRRWRRLIKNNFNYNVF